MSQTERSGDRNSDLLYSTWHRTASIRRFVSADEADCLAMINLDALLRCERWIENCGTCREPLAVIEVAWENGQDHKTAAATRQLALRAGCEAYAVLITPTPDRSDIQSFRVRQVAPLYSEWHHLAPLAYAQMLVRVRNRAKCACTTVEVEAA